MKWVNHNEMEDVPNLMKFLFLNCKINPNRIPIIRIIKIIVLLLIDINRIWSDDNNQVIIDPDEIPNVLRSIIGIIEFIDWWLDDKGLDLIIDLFGEIDIRIE